MSDNQSRRRIKPKRRPKPEPMNTPPVRNPVKNDDRRWCMLMDWAVTPEACENCAASEFGKSHCKGYKPISQSPRKRHRDKGGARPQCATCGREMGAESTTGLCRECWKIWLKEKKMRALRPCRFLGCTNHTRKSAKFCPEHALKKPRKRCSYPGCWDFVSPGAKRRCAAHSKSGTFEMSGAYDSKARAVFAKAKKNLSYQASIRYVFSRIVPAEASHLERLEVYDSVEKAVRNTIDPRKLKGSNSFRCINGDCGIPVVGDVCFGCGAKYTESDMIAAKLRRDIDGW